MSTESDNSSSIRELKLMQDIEKLKNELSELKTVKLSNERLVAEKEELNKEYLSFKKDVDTKEYFKNIGGKEEYLEDFKKLWDGNKFDESAKASFKTRMSNMFNKEEIKAGSPANAVAGESQGDGILADTEEDKGLKVVYTQKDGGVPIRE